LLSVIASQELSAPLWQVWDVDQSSDNLLVEARPEWEDGELKSLVCYPQLTFEPYGPVLRGDVEEMQQFGSEDFGKVLLLAIHRAFERFRGGNKRSLHLERVRSHAANDENRFPPRVYTTHSISEIAENVRDQSFILRYITAEDKYFALRSLSNLDLDSKERFSHWRRTLGSRRSTVSVYFDLGLTVRALMKIAVNLLASYCSHTAVNCDTFRAVTRFVLGRSHPQPLHVAPNGFVHAEDVAELAKPDSHSFRITYLEGQWIVYSCFFAGQLGAVVSFPGPNMEQWNTMEIAAPIRSKHWTVTTSKLCLPLRVHVSWSNSKAITPSLKMLYRESALLVQRMSVKKS
jgi:hypothetical protein